MNRRFVRTSGIATACIIGSMTSVSMVGAQTETINFPANWGVVDVTKAPYNADNTGATDATAAIQAALDSNKTTTVIYFPNGTYKVSNTLRGPTYGVDGGTHGPEIVGQNRKLTVIRLQDGVFTNAASPKPVLITGDGVAQNFDRALHNMTVCTGRNNPGANGVYWYANNRALCSELDIISLDGQGVKGLDLGYGEQGPCGVKSVYVKGFQYGVYSDALNGVALTQITVEGQSVAGVWNENRYVWYDSLTSINTVSAVVNKGDMLLINAHLSGGSSSNVAIRHQSGSIFVRNAVAQGYSRAITSANGTVTAPTGMTVDEYSSLGYQRLWTESPAASMNLPIQRAPQVPWEQDVAKWGNARLYKGGLGQPQRSDRQALQAAIDDPNKTTVFLKGLWQCDDTVYLRGKIQRLVGGSASISGPALVITDQCSSGIVGVNWVDGAPIINRSSRTVVLQSVHLKVYAQGTGELYIVDIAQGVRVMNAQQRVWMWHFNAEGGPMDWTNSADNFSLRVDAGRA